MIVPRTRLLVWVGAILLPSSLLAATNPAALVPVLAIIGLFLLLAVVDVLLVPGRLSGVDLLLPPVVRLSKNRPAQIDLQIRNAPQVSLHLRVALAFPPQIRPREEQLDVVLPAHSELSRVTLECLPLERGNYSLQRAYLETASPLGFWALRRSAGVTSEWRVYPNLLSERKNLAALFLHRGALGVHAQRQVGKGRDFEKLREYIPGDSFEDIHWKATAKRGHPVTKIFQIERTQEVYLIIDGSRLSARTVKSLELEAGSPASEVRGQKSEKPPASDPTVLERFITVALIMGLAAEQQGDLFGLLTFSDKIERFVRARNGRAHYTVCRDALYSLEPRIVTPDFDEVITFLRLRLRRRALLVFLTALDDPVLAENFAHHLDIISRQHLILVNMMKPPGAEPLFSQANVASVDDLYGALGGHLQWHNLRELEKTLQRRGVRFSQLENERMSLQLVTQYLGVKQRQLL